MQRQLLMISALLLAAAAQAQNVYELTAPSKPKEIRCDHLRMGGVANDRRIDVNNFYLSFDGRPVIPVMGEFHFVRYPEAQWEEEIVKMKAGGVSVLTTMRLLRTDTSVVVGNASKRFVNVSDCNLAWFGELLLICKSIFTISTTSRTLMELSTHMSAAVKLKRW